MAIKGFMHEIWMLLILNTATKNSGSSLGAHTENVHKFIWGMNSDSPLVMLTNTLLDSPSQQNP